MHYIVMRLGYEYNDEYYYTGEDGGGHPVGVYDNKEEAEDIRLDLERKAWRGQEVQEFLGYDNSEPEGFKEDWIEIFGEPADDGVYIVPKFATNKQVDQFLELIDWRMYYIEMIK